MEYCLETPIIKFTGKKSRNETDFKFYNLDRAHAPKSRVHKHAIIYTHVCCFFRQINSPFRKNNYFISNLYSS